MIDVMFSPRRERESANSQPHGIPESVRSLGGALILLFVALEAHGQVITCAGVSTGQGSAACTAPTANNAPAGNSEVLWCSSGAVAGAAQNTCAVAQWYPWNNMQPYSWVLTSYAGWQRQSNVTLNNGATPAPPSTPVASGNVTLTWAAATKNADGSPISSVLGYVISYGMGNFASTVTTSGLSYTFTNLGTGTWQFEIATTTAAGTGTPGNPATVVVNSSAPPSTPPTSWKTSATTVYEPVLPKTGTALVLGTTQGTVPTGKPCGSEVVAVGSTSYRSVTETDLTLASPSYQGRKHVSVCTLY